MTSTVLRRPDKRRTEAKYATFVIKAAIVTLLVLILLAATLTASISAAAAAKYSHSLNNSFGRNRTNVLTEGLPFRVDSRRSFEARWQRGGSSNTAAGTMSSTAVSRVLQQQTASALCAAVIDYDATLGDIGRLQDLQRPTFLASVHLAVVQQAATLQSWVLQWQFTAGEYIEFSRDLSGDSGTLEVYLATAADGQQSVSVVGSDYRVAPGPDSGAGFNFVGHKGPASSSTTAGPFRVAAPGRMQLNNVVCDPLPFSSMAAAGRSSNSSNYGLGGTAAASMLANITNTSSSTFPAGSSCTQLAEGDLLCGVSMQYCCSVGGSLSSSLPPAWRQYTGGNVGQAVDASSSTDSSTQPYIVALAVVLSAVALLAAVLLILLVRQRQRSRQHDSVPAGRDPSTALALPLHSLQHGSVGGSHEGSFALIPIWSRAQSRSQQRALQEEESLLDAGQQLSDSVISSPPVSSPFAHPAWQQQQLQREQGQHDGRQVYAAPHRIADAAHSDEAHVEGAQHVQTFPLAWLMRGMGKSMPEDVLIRAVQQYSSTQRTLEDRSEVHSSSENKGSCSLEAPDLPLRRCNTWSDRLHEDAFGQDLLEHLLQLHMRRHSKPNNSGSGSFRTSQTAATAAAAQLRVQRTGVSASAAAAIMGAVAAIGASLVGAGSRAAPAAAADQDQPPRQQHSCTTASDSILPQRSSHSSHDAAPAAATVCIPSCYASFSLCRPSSMTAGTWSGLSGSADGAASTLGAAAAAAVPAHGSSGVGAAGFLQVLLASGGVTHAPGGPSIPLNVDFASEIQPHLGPLLGRGGFGHVYEATWRGQRVAVKLLSVDTEDPAVLDAVFKEVALCTCLRECDRVVKLLGAALGGGITTTGSSSSKSQQQQQQQQQQHQQHVATTSALSAGTPATPRPAAMMLPASKAPSLSRCNGGTGTCSSTDVGKDSTASNWGSVPSPFVGQLPAAVHAVDDTGSGGCSDCSQRHCQQLALIMELVEGGNLAQRIYHPSKRRLTYLEVLQIGLDIAQGLAYLHPAIIHRDLKPQNVLLDKAGRAKIADFGISRFKGPGRGSLSVTHQGGTPNYMAPELFNGTHVDEAADVYSLGCILYECLARQQPFGQLVPAGGAKSFNMLFKIIVAVAINKERPQLPSCTPPRLASLIARCWLEDPAQRPAVPELEAELHHMIQEECELQAKLLGRVPRPRARTTLGQAARSKSTPVPAGHSSSSDNTAVSMLGAGVSARTAAAAAPAGAATTSPATHLGKNAAAAASAAAAAAGCDDCASAGALSEEFMSAATGPARNNIPPGSPDRNSASLAASLRKAVAAKADTAGATALYSAARCSHAQHHGMTGAAAADRTMWKRSPSVSVAKLQRGLMRTASSGADPSALAAAANAAVLAVGHPDMAYPTSVSTTMSAARMESPVSSSSSNFATATSLAASVMPATADQPVPQYLTTAASSITSSAGRQRAADTDAPAASVTRRYTYWPFSSYWSMQQQQKQQQPEQLSFATALPPQPAAIPATGASPALAYTTAAPGMSLPTDSSLAASVGPGGSRRAALQRHVLSTSSAPAPPAQVDSASVCVLQQGLSQQVYYTGGDSYGSEDGASQGASLPAPPLPQPGAASAGVPDVLSSNGPAQLPTQPAATSLLSASVDALRPDTGPGCRDQSHLRSSSSSMGSPMRSSKGKSLSFSAVQESACLVPSTNAAAAAELASGTSSLRSSFEPQRSSAGFYASALETTVKKYGVPVADLASVHLPRQEQQQQPQQPWWLYHAYQPPPPQQVQQHHSQLLSTGSQGKSGSATRPAALGNLNCTPSCPSALFVSATSNATDD